MEDFVLTLVLSDSGFQGWILQRAQLTFLTWPCSTTEDLHHKYLFNWNKPASTKHTGKHTPPHRHTHKHAGNGGCSLLWWNAWLYLQGTSPLLRQDLE